MRAKKSFSIYVLGQKWKIKLLTEGMYHKHIAIDSVAECHMSEKVIFFDIAQMTCEVIRHELSHAYLKEMSFVELQLDIMQLEELFCELVGKHSETIIDQAKYIFGTIA